MVFPHVYNSMRCAGLGADQNWFQHFWLSQMLLGKGQYPIVPIKGVLLQSWNIYCMFLVELMDLDLDPNANQEEETPL